MYHKDNPVLPIHLDLVGDGPQRRELEILAQRLGIEELTSFKGWVSKEDLPDIYRHGNIFILPSIDEGLPNAVLEAMASGLPVIASSTLGNEGLIKNGVTGFLIPANNPSALAERIHYFMKDQAKIKKMGCAARKHVVNHFSWQQAACEFEDILDACKQTRMS